MHHGFMPSTKTPNRSVALAALTAELETLRVEVETLESVVDWLRGDDTPMPPNVVEVVEPGRTVTVEPAVERTYACGECGDVFDRPQGLGSHKRYKHPAKKKPSKKPKPAKDETPTSEPLIGGPEMHQAPPVFIRKSAPEPRPTQEDYKCAQCSRVFPDEKHLELHGRKFGHSIDD